MVEEGRTDVWVGATPPLGETAEYVCRMTEDAKDGVDADASVQKRENKTIVIITLQTRIDAKVVY